MPNSDFARYTAATTESLLSMPSALTQDLEEKKASHRSLNLLADIARASIAKESFDRLNHQIKQFDEGLDQDHEVGVKLVSFGPSVTFHVEFLGFHNPNLIFFHGVTADGDRMQLIQHVNQISFVLLAMRKPNPEEPKRLFGFAQAQEPSDQVS